MSYIAFIVILIAIAMVQLLNKVKNQTYFVNINIYVFCILIILIFVKYFTESMIGASLFIFPSSLIIISLIDFKIILRDNCLIIKQGIFSKKTTIELVNIEKIFITNEFVTDASQFFINLVLINSNVEKIPLLFVSPLHLLTQIKERNPKIDIKLSDIEKTIKRDSAITFVFYIISLISLLYALLFYSK